MQLTLESFLSLLTQFTQYFSLYDYLILSSIFLGILLFFLLSILLSSNTIVCFLMLFMSAILFFASPFIYQYIMQTYLKKIELTLSHNSKLQYDDIYYIKGTIKNAGSLDLKGCVVTTNFIPKNSNQFQQIKYTIRPIFRHKETYKKPLKKQESFEFEALFEAPKSLIYSNYKLQTQADCY
ncbi:DUF2393 domain-containing protein [Helicobacter canadensis]|uniref:DUF2393 domain-containing protein n=1 Tax=Helicobacter canadensis MIT 98-5491 TaxID=537970 RepID=C5ZY05_9HELI|nr:DUF2393 domain-containing protein [Helicobacter canadensis]EES90023.1 hypothetical protein HCAN_1314 [Helicobacter canadensis MIT 98-5491]EFR49173.1 hypothetical protein HCMG_01346 [Helicobacter canadensis MIT 98-5491]STP02477.1 Uncharacterised protein [Helicobacter canadensis]